MEALHGILRRPELDVARQTLESFIEDVPKLPVTRNVAERCAQVRAALTLQQRRVRPRALDLIIAATALEYGLTLVTRNLDDYRDIPGLTVY